MVSLDKCNGRCDAVDDISLEICVLSETKNANVKVVNMITRVNEIKILLKCISCDCKCKFNSSTCKSNQKWNKDKYKCECRMYLTCKKDCTCNPSRCIF